MAGVLSDRAGSVKDGITSSGSNSKTLATQNLRKRVRTGDASGQSGWRRWFGFDPIDPADRFGIRGDWANWLTIDIEDGEGETEVLRVEMEVAKNRVVPGAGRVCWIRPQRIVVGNVGQAWNRLAVRWFADI